MVFADITGQESTVTALSNAIKSGRIMHAYLFCGPRGTGKTSSARIFAKSLNCIEGPTVTPCGKCSGCLDVINSTPVDVIEIDAASNRSVEDARNILEKVQYAPLHGKYKIYIIDEVHMLTTEASNTLLKTLEEPPENVIFILATTESHKVLETIVSRCQRYDFRRITTSDIVKRLEFIAKSENIQIDTEALLAVAKNAAGGMRDAVALLDQLSVLGQNRNITIEDVNELLGQISYDTIFDIANCINDANTEKALSILNEIHDRGNEPSRVLIALIQYFRDMLILKSCSDKNVVLSMTRINEEIFDKIKTQSENFETQTLIYFADKLSYYFNKLKENTNKYMWAELCVIDLTSTPKIPTIADLAEKVAILENQLATGNIKKQMPEIKAVPQEKTTTDFVKPQIQTRKVEEKPSSKNEEKHSSTNEEISKPTASKDDWAQITAEVKGPAKFFYSKLAKLVELNRHKIVLAFANEGGAKQANDPIKKESLQKAACEYFGVDSIQVVIKVGATEVKKKPDVEEEISVPSVAPSDFEKPKAEKPQAEKPKFEIPKINTKKIETLAEKNDEDNEFLNTEETFECEECGANPLVLDVKPSVNVDMSDTAKNIAELFDGKITN